MKQCPKCNANNNDDSKFCCQCGAELNKQWQINEAKKGDKLSFKDGVGCIFVLLVIGVISYVGNEVLHLHGSVRLLFGIGCFFAIAMIWGLFYGIYLHIFHKD